MTELSEEEKCKLFDELYEAVRVLPSKLWTLERLRELPEQLVREIVETEGSRDEELFGPQYEDGSTAPIAACQRETIPSVKPLVEVLKTEAK